MPCSYKVFRHHLNRSLEQKHFKSSLYMEVGRVRTQFYKLVKTVLADKPEDVKKSKLCYSTTQKHSRHNYLGYMKTRTMYKIRG